MQSHPFPRYLVPPRSKYSPQHPVLKHPQLLSSLNVNDQVSHPYKTTGKIIILYILIFKFLGSNLEDKRFCTEWYQAFPNLNLLLISSRTETYMYTIYICIYLFIYLLGTAVAQWLRCCATNRKVAGLIPASVIGFFIDIKSFRSHYGPVVDSASDRNEYQEHFLGVKVAGA